MPNRLTALLEGVTHEQAAEPTGVIDPSVVKRITTVLPVVGLHE